MFPRRKDVPPPPPDAPGMTLEEAMKKTKISTSSSSKPSSSSTSKPKEKTAYEIEIVDQTVTSRKEKEKTVSSRDREKEREKEKRKEKEKQREKEKEREKEKQKEKARQREKSAVNLTRVDESSKPRRTRIREDTKYPFDYEDRYNERSPSPSPSAKQVSHFPSIRARTIVSSSRRPPPSTPSTLRHGDQDMAQRQTRYDSLTPAQQERQKTWVQDYLSRAAPCPADFPWRREDKHYRCYGSSHVITDELIAEGRGGFYIYTPAFYNDASCTIPFFGPYYPTTTSPDIIYVYSGSQPKPRHAPDRMIGLISEWDDQSANFELTQIQRRNKLNWKIEDMVALNPALVKENGEVNYAVLNKINEIRAEVQRKLKEMQRRQRGSGGRYNPGPQGDPYNRNPGPGGYGGSGYGGYGLQR